MRIVISPTKTRFLRWLKRGSIPARLVFVLLSGALSFVAPGVQAQQQVGYVVDLEGNWSLNGRAGLSRGQSLPGGGSISAISPTDYDHIVIANLKGAIIARKTCRNRGECNAPIRLPAPPEQPGIIASAFGAAMNLIWGEPDRYSVHRTRSGELLDAVVQLTGDDQLDMGPVFSKSDAGKYYLRFTRVAVGRQGGKALARTAQSSREIRQANPISFDWNPNHPVPVAVPNIRPGLYLLTILEQQNGAYSPSDLNSWILVSGPNTYGRSAASYQKAVEVTAGWGNAVTPEASRGFLRAHLDQLAKGALR
ncbi:MAG TPA: hypothetical protein VMS31_02380 [Pyrinomonadaceae bacterium]|nr:hypothetical protein [Pyrinomonadaceae bacterium]